MICRDCRMPVSLRAVYPGEESPGLLATSVWWERGRDSRHLALLSLCPALPAVPRCRAPGFLPRGRRRPAAGTGASRCPRTGTWPVLLSAVLPHRPPSEAAGDSSGCCCVCVEEGLVLAFPPAGRTPASSVSGSGTVSALSVCPLPQCCSRSALPPLLVSALQRRPFSLCGPGVAGVREGQRDGPTFTAACGAAVSPSPAQCSIWVLPGAFVLPDTCLRTHLRLVLGL